MPRNDLTIQQRIVIFYLNMTGQSNAQIARKIGCHRATVGRELQRNRTPFGHYLPDFAQRMADQRRRKPRHRPVTGDAPLMRHVEDRLMAGWSPEQIAGRLQAVGHDRLPGRSISHATIYHWIWACPERGRRLKPHLRVACKPRRKPYGTPSRRGQIPGRVSIDQRPGIVDARRRVGDWEVDTVVGTSRSGYITTAVERRSRYLVARQVDQATSQAVCDALYNSLRRLPAEQLLTLTADNGREFTQHKQLARRLGVDVYFAHPYSSWERGTNENTNGLLRQYVPKKMDLKCLTDSRLAAYVRRLNLRPRKPRFHMVAYTGGLMRIEGFPHPVVVDLEGLEIPRDRVPIRLDHDRRQGVGHADRVAVEDGKLVAEGSVSRNNPWSRDVADSSAEGYPWQAIEEGWDDTAHTS